jgi:hypothetical protein
MLRDSGLRSQEPTEGLGSTTRPFLSEGVRNVLTSAVTRKPSWKLD